MKKLLRLILGVLLFLPLSVGAGTLDGVTIDGYSPYHDPDDPDWSIPLAINIRPNQDVGHNPLGNGTFTHSADDRKYIDPDDGLLKSPGVDNARIEDPNSEGQRGVLIEPKGKNICLQSRNFDTSPWINAGANPTANATGVDGGANKAFTVSHDGSGGWKSFSQPISISADTTSYCAGFFIKKTTSATTFPGMEIGFTGGTNNYGSITINTDVGTITSRDATAPDDSGITDTGGDFWQVWVIHSSPTSDNTTFSLHLYVAVNTDASGTWVMSNTVGSNVIDYAQIKVAKFPSSPIDNDGVAIGAELITDFDDNITTTPASKQAVTSITAVATPIYTPTAGAEQIIASDDRDFTTFGNVNWAGDSGGSLADGTGKLEITMDSSGLCGTTLISTYTGIVSGNMYKFSVDVWQGTTSETSFYLSIGGSPNKKQITIDGVQTTYTAYLQGFEFLALQVKANTSDNGTFFIDNASIKDLGPATGYHILAGADEVLGAELAAGALTIGTVYVITARTDGDFTAVGASASTVGVYFTATGTGEAPQLLDAGDKVKQVLPITHGESVSLGTWTDGACTLLGLDLSDAAAAITTGYMIPVSNSDWTISVPSNAGIQIDGGGDYEQQLTNSDFSGTWTGDLPDDWTIVGAEAGSNQLTADDANNRLQMVSDGNDIGIKQACTDAQLYYYEVDVQTVAVGSFRVKTSSVHATISATGVSNGFFTADAAFAEVSCTTNLDDITLNSFKLWKVDNVYVEWNGKGAADLTQIGTPAEADKVYRLAHTATRSAGSYTAEFGSTDGAAVSAAGTYYDYPTSVDTDYIKFKADDTFAGTIDVVSIKTHGTARTTESGNPFWDLPSDLFAETLGADLIVASDDRDFSSDTGWWTTDVNADINTTTAGKCHFGGVGINTVGVYRNALSTVGKTYKIIYTISGLSAGALQVACGSAGGTIQTANGTYSEYIVPNGTPLYFRARSAETTLDLDDVSIKEVTNAWDDKPPHGTMTFCFRLGFDPGTDISAGDYKIIGPVGFTNTDKINIKDGTTTAEHAVTIDNDVTYKGAAKWGYLTDNVAQMAIVVDSDRDGDVSDETWTEADWDGDFGLTNLPCGETLAGPMHFSTLGLWDRILDDTEIDVLEGP